MDFKEAISYIHSIPRGRKNYDFKEIRRVLGYFGNPQDELKFIHIAGTNGKGSAASFISAVLSCASYKTGKFISPFIEKFNERISIDNTLIGDDEIAELVTYIKDTLIKHTGTDSHTLSEFEFVTVMAFIYFKKMDCDLVVLECGMGGLYDATNVISTTVASVIMKIDFDHMQFLGNTIEEIATHKCGIIKPKCPVISYRNQTDSVKSVIEKKAKETDSPLFYADDAQIKSATLYETVFSVPAFDNLSLSLIGTHQVENAAVAVKVFEVLTSCGYKIGDEAIKKGLKSAVNIGRFEVMGKNPVVIIDGAHNANGIDALAESAKKYLEGKPITVVFGMLDDKDAEYSIEKISEFAQRIIFTTVSSYRHITAENLKNTLKTDIVSMTIDSPVEAVSYAIKTSSKDGCVLVIGSLYLMGEVRQYLNNTQMR